MDAQFLIGRQKEELFNKRLYVYILEHYFHLEVYLFIYFYAR